MARPLLPRLLEPGRRAARSPRPRRSVPSSGPSTSSWPPSTRTPTSTSTTTPRTSRRTSGKLMGRYDTRQVEVDQLFRGDTLVDLFQVVRQGLRASVESYSIKTPGAALRLPSAQIGLRDAGSSIEVFERWLRMGGIGGVGEDLLAEHRGLQPRRRALDLAAARLAGRAACGARLGGSGRRCPGQRSSRVRPTRSCRVARAGGGRGETACGPASRRRARSYLDRGGARATASSQTCWAGTAASRSRTGGASSASSTT